MVVLQFIDSLYRGGAQRVVLDIVRALPGHTHIVCYWSDECDLKNEFLNEGVKTVQIPFDGIVTFPKAYFAFKRIIKQYSPDVVHTHMFMPNLLARLAPGNQIRISTYHGEVFSRPGFFGLLIRVAEKMTLFRSDELIAVSHYVERYLKKKLNTKREINVIHNFGHVLADKPLCLEQLPLRLVATSNNQSYKDYPLLIHAMNKLRDQPIVLDIYGNGMDPLKKLVIDLNIENVNFMGVVSEVGTVLNKYSAFVITSHSGEGFSLALLEAMKMGLPIVCSNLPQFLEATDKDAFIFERSNLEDLVKKILLLLENHQNLKTYSSAISKRALLFSQENFVRKIGDIYNKYVQLSKA